MLKYCDIFGIDFSSLTGTIANELYRLPEMSEWEVKEYGPHRYGDDFCSRLDAELAFGGAVASVLSSDWCDQTIVAKLCQAILPNEDPWIYRTRPRPCEKSGWLSEDEYGGKTIDNGTRHQQMLSAATKAAIAKGWRCFAAHVVDYTDNEDFSLDYWFEEVGLSMIINAVHRPSCLGGRSFAWWIGQPVEPSNAKVTSGFFVGGHTRLFHCQFQIRPPRWWRDELGWEPNPSNPLEWHLKGEPVAVYERLHGMLRDNFHGRKYRQRLIDRWIITDNAFEQVESTKGTLLARNDFRRAKLGSD